MPKKTRNDLFIAATYAAVLFIGILFGQYYTRDERAPTQSSAVIPIGVLEKPSKVQQTLELISASYVDSVNLDSLQNEVIKDLVSKLDPHSDFMIPTLASKQTQALEGNFEGIGVEYYLLKDTLLVVGLVPNGPAQQA